MQSATSRRAGFTWRVWLVMALVLVLPVVLLTLWLLPELGGETEPDQEMAALARQNADAGQISVFTGTRHTVYHSTLPLPRDGVTRRDGRLTLVWWAQTSCGSCADMRPFAQEIAADYRGPLVFVEKAIDRDLPPPGLEVPGTPWFTLLAEDGTLIAEFGNQPTAEAFRAAIKDALAEAP